MTSEIKRLESECVDLEKGTDNQEDDINRIEINDKLQQEKDLKAHMDEVNTIKKKNQRLKEELEKRLSGK